MPAIPTPSVNHWPEPRCAKAFWSQHELPPYQKLLDDTTDWLEVRPGQAWLDLGCGCGQLTRALWQKSGNELGEVVSLDVSARNEREINRLRTDLPDGVRGRLRFVHADFGGGLATWSDGHFDGVVSGLAIQYAESYSDSQERWTTDAYDRLLSEVYRVLGNGGQFVFSVNVPEPAWGKVALHALGGLLRSAHPTRFVKNAWNMYRYGGWLKREARRGRFHYLPVTDIVPRLHEAGFATVDHRVSYVGQAFVFRCRKAG
jgi:ubiquinone/menaquinone biosynthesis C-methylase UbiE